MKTSHYYNILGVSKNAGIREIKKAFRIKAKAFHPDINKTEGAHEKFLDINEAYTYLMNLHGKYAGNISDQTAHENYYHYWMEKERQKARARAAQRARMRFEEFKQSPLYKTTNILSHMLDFFLLFIGIFIILAAGFGLYSQGLYITDNDKETLNIKGIVAYIIITIVGILFILLSWSRIKEYRGKIGKNKKL